MFGRSVAFLSIALGGLFGAHWAQVRTDDTRWNRPDDLRQIFVPSPEATRVAAMGFDLVAADLLWTRSVLLFVDFLDKEQVHGAEWTRTVLETVTTLDPNWRTPFFYGGSMLRLLEDIDGSDVLFKRGEAAFPGDAYFPFSLAMNAYLHRGDLEAATEHLTKAAQLPSAPKWYRNAAAEFIHRGGQRKAAVKYLNDQIEAAGSERERFLLTQKRNDLVYEQLEEQLLERQEKWEAHHGRLLDDANRLAPLPPDPHGGVWMVGGDGRIRSSVVEPKVAMRARNEERSTLVNP